MLAQALTQAQRWDLVPRNVASLSTPPKVVHKDTPRSLTTEQAVVLVNALKGERLKAGYLLMLGVGLRRGEALGLWWEDIDFAEATVTVNHQLKTRRAAS